MRPAFAGVLRAPTEIEVSYGLPFDQACVKHIRGFLDRKRVYIIASKNLVFRTDHLHDLQAALGDRHAGSWGWQSGAYTLEGLVALITFVRARNTDCLIAFGGGSVIDGAKTLAFVSGRRLPQ